MNPNAMDSFSLPTGAFDVTLLPPAVRGIGSSEFNAAVSEFFTEQFRGMGVNGRVVVTPETIQVAWSKSGADPVELGIEKLQRGQLKEGCQWLELLRGRFPGSERLLQNLGIGLSELGHYDRAIECLRHLLEVAPKNHRGRVALGVALGRKGELSAAILELRKVVEEAPEDLWGQKNLGGILFRQGLFAEAMPHLEKAVSLDPADGHAWLILGETLLARDETGRAREALQKARSFSKGKLQERAESLLNRLADTLFERGEDGLRSAVVAGLVWAIRTLDHVGDEQAKRSLILQAAMLGQSGLTLTDPKPVHTLEGYTGDALSGFQVACLIHAGVQRLAPGTATGFNWEAEYVQAVKLANEV
jgi:predicted Zn-dependent protease